MSAAPSAVPSLKVKNTWFFAAYEHNSTIEPTSASSTTLPHPTLLAGDFSLMKDSTKPSVGTAVLTPSEIATDTVGGLGTAVHPDSLAPSESGYDKTHIALLPQSRNLGSDQPLHGHGCSPLHHVDSLGRLGQDEGTLRIDHDFSDSNRIYGVYHASAQNIAMNPVVGVFTGLGLSQTDRRNNTVSLSYTHVFSAASGQ